MQKKEFYGPKSKKLSSQEATRLKKEGKRSKTSKDSEGTGEKTGRGAWTK